MDNQTLKKIQSEYKTPCFVFDLDAAQNRAENIRKIVGDKIKLCYAAKANPFLLSEMQHLCDKLEICSPGELAICEKIGANMQKIVFSGVNKTQQDIAKAVKNNVLIYTVESEKHLFLLNQAGEKANKKLPILLRLSNGSQFGVDEQTIFNIIQNVKKYSGVSIEGLHFFTGTQKRKSEEVIKELDYIENFCETLEKNYNFKVKKLEYGPGFKVPYFEGDDFADSLLPLKQTADKLRSLTEKYDLTIEMGRFFAADCGYYITKVEDTKTTFDTNYCIVDGGIHHLNYYGQTMAMKKPIMRHFAACDILDSENKKDINTTNCNNNQTKNWTICGSLCTTADLIVKNATFTSLCGGDTIVFENVGAYSITESPYLFLSRTMPRVVLLKEGKTVLARDFIQTFNFNTL